MLLVPFFPAGVFKVQHRQLPLKIGPLDALQAVFIWIPQRAGFFIVQNKGAVIGPARRHQRNVASVDPAAVHSR